MTTAHDEGRRVSAEVIFPRLEIVTLYLVVAMCLLYHLNRTVTCHVVLAQPQDAIQMMSVTSKWKHCIVP